jgi:hypothetical protein
MLLGLTPCRPPAPAGILPQSGPGHGQTKANTNTKGPPSSHALGPSHAAPPISRAHLAAFRSTPRALCCKRRPHSAKRARPQVAFTTAILALLTGPRFSAAKSRHCTASRRCACTVSRGEGARLEIILSKEVDRWFEAVGQLYLWLPSEFCFRQRNIWPALFGVVLRQHHVDQL